MEGRKLFRITEWIFGIVMVLIIGVNVLLDNRVYYVCQNNCVIPNFVFLILFVLLCAGGLFFVKRKQKNSDKTVLTPMYFDRVMRNIKILSLVLLVVQIIYAYNIYFETGWDCRELVKMAQAIAFEDAKIGDAHYFSLYPNNAFLTGIFAGILKLIKFVGINNAPYFPLIIVGCALVTLSGYLMADCVRILTGKKSLIIGFWVVFVLLTGLSPWISIPYSDTYSIIFPTAAVWLYLTKTDDNCRLRWFLISLVCFVGYFIKPTVFLTFMVLVFFDVLHYFLTFNKRHAKEKIKAASFCLIMSVLGIFAAFMLRFGVERATGFEPDGKSQVTPIHYFMMGLNSESGGGYNQADVNYSFGFETVSERNREDWKLAMQRIKEMFPVRLVTFEAQKALTNFNDGTFAWGNEGDFYWTYYEKDNFLAKFIRNRVYHIGDRHQVYVAFTQGIWMFVLFMCALVFINRKKHVNYREVALMVVVLAIFAFLMVFEARARYLYLYSPVIYMVAAIGLNRLYIGKDNAE